AMSMPMPPTDTSFEAGPHAARPSWSFRETVPAPNFSCALASRSPSANIIVRCGKFISHHNTTCYASSELR
ncbi:hypothetical protein PtrEW7m1_001659, partial [Pyrenophora tritici-repentis]